MNICAVANIRCMVVKQRVILIDDVSFDFLKGSLSVEKDKKNVRHGPGFEPSESVASAGQSSCTRTVFAGNHGPLFMRLISWNAVDGPNWIQGKCPRQDWFRNRKKSKSVAQKQHCVCSGLACSHQEKHENLCRRSRRCRCCDCSLSTSTLGRHAGLKNFLTSSCQSRRVAVVRRYRRLSNGRPG